MSDLIGNGRLQRDSNDHYLKMMGAGNPELILSKVRMLVSNSVFYEVNRSSPCGMRIQQRFSPAKALPLLSVPQSGRLPCGAFP